MTAYLPFLIPLGLALFILRAQILRVAIRAEDIENLHASKALGAASGWASLFGALLLVGCAIVLNGIVWGIVSILIGLALGVAASALFLPMLGNTLAFGHHGGDGDKSIAAFNRSYGHWIAFAVGGLGLVALLSIFNVISAL
ncbi:MAG: hypothetical protein ACRC7G_06050 [Beijerinckiaceae bacterium]